MIWRKDFLHETEDVCFVAGSHTSHASAKPSFQHSNPTDDSMTSVYASDICFYVMWERVQWGQIREQLFFSVVSADFVSRALFICILFYTMNTEGVWAETDKQLGDIRDACLCRRGFRPRRWRRGEERRRALKGSGPFHSG